MIAWTNVEPVLALSRAMPFDFVSAQLGASFELGALGETPTMTITGFRRGVEVHSAVVTLTCNGFALETFGWRDVDRVELSRTSVDVNRIVVCSGTVVTPEPATVALLGAGLLGVAAVARRRR